MGSNGEVMGPAARWFGKITSIPVNPGFRHDSRTCRSTPRRVVSADQTTARSSSIACFGQFSLRSFPMFLEDRINQGRKSYTRDENEFTRSTLPWVKRIANLQFKQQLNLRKFWSNKANLNCTLAKYCNQPKNTLHVFVFTYEYRNKWAKQNDKWA